MQTLKKIFIAAIAMVMAFSLVACGGKADLSSVQGKTYESTNYSVLIPDGWTDACDGEFARFYKDDAQVSVQYNSTKVTLPDDAKEVSYEINGETWKGGCIADTNTVFTKEVDGLHLTIQCYNCTPDDVEVAAAIASIDLHAAK